MNIVSKTPTIIITLPAYNAEKTLRKTVQSLPRVSKHILLCDDGSADNTALLSRGLGIITIRHPHNRGYGANQKTLYALAQEKGADIIVMVHPDNQYDTSVLPSMIDIVMRGEASLVLGSRMAQAKKNGMPWWKIAGNRFLTSVQNAAYHTSLSEFHSGLRVFDAALLETMPYQSFSDDFVFDSEFIAWTIANRRAVAEVPTRCYYNDTSSSINLSRSITYGLATLKTLVVYVRGGYGKATAHGKHKRQRTNRG